jgi:hypothetical protein
MMGLGPQNRQMVVAVTLAVVAALGIAATVTYGFSSATSSTAGTTSNTIPSIDCTSTKPPMLNVSPNSTLKEDGTTEIGGTSYWYVSFIQGNLTTVYFHGVQFAFNDFMGSTFPGVSVGSQISIDATLLTTKTSPSGLYCASFLPQITITFPDGSSVVYNKETVSLTPVGANITFAKPASNPWFTQHISPQAGLAYQTNGGQITLYVSVS